MKRAAPFGISAFFVRDRPAAQKRTAMLLKEAEVRLHALKLRPALDVHGIAVKIVDLRPAQGKQKGGVRRDDELTVKKARLLFQELFEFELLLRGEAVLGLV